MNECADIDDDAATTLECCFHCWRIDLLNRTVDLVDQSAPGMAKYLSTSVLVLGRDKFEVHPVP